MKTSVYLLAFAGLLSASSALAQTPLRSGPPLPPNAQPVQQGTPANAVQPLPGVPVADSTVAQAKAHIEGQFGVMNRPSIGGQVQEAWNETTSRDGVYQYVDCAGACVYKVRLREYMVSAIRLPDGVKIHSIDLGDAARFEAQLRAENILALKPMGGGMDSSLQVYTTTGEIYSFYLRAEGFNSENIPDLVVTISPRALPKLPLVPLPVEDVPVLPEPASVPESTEPEARDLTAEDPDDKAKKDALADLNVTDLAPVTPESLTDFADQIPADTPTTPRDHQTAAKDADDFVKAAPFDPDKLHGFGDYTLWGDEDLRPERVFRDDHFTYVQFGDRWKDVEYPTPYVVVDDIDELVNSRRSGRTMIVESTQKLITLKSGQSYLCIQYEGA